MIFINFRSRNCIYESTFTQVDHFYNYFGFFLDICNLTIVDSDTLIKSCHDLQLLLQIGENMDIRGTELYDELCLPLEEIENCASPLQILQKILSNSVGDVYTNVAIVLKITLHILTLSVTTATTKIWFPNLKFMKKLLKNYIKSEKQRNYQ